MILLQADILSICSKRLRVYCLHALLSGCLEPECGRPAVFDPPFHHTNILLRTHKGQRNILPLTADNVDLHATRADSSDRGDSLEEEHASLFLSAFPMFAPSLSWQNDHLYMESRGKDAFLAPALRLGSLCPAKPPPLCSRLFFSFVQSLSWQNDRCSSLQENATQKAVPHHFSQDSTAILQDRRDIHQRKHLVTVVLRNGCDLQRRA